MAEKKVRKGKSKLPQKIEKLPKNYNASCIFLCNFVSETFVAATSI
jgi:hypothetical protein